MRVRTFQTPSPMRTDPSSTKAVSSSARVTYSTTDRLEPPSMIVHPRCSHWPKIS